MAKVDLLSADVEAFLFDAYGTLFDVHAAVSVHAAAIGPDTAALSHMWRTKQLEYTWIHALAGRYVPFWTLTERALDYALERHGLSSIALRTMLLDAYRTVPAFPEARSTLVRLRGLGCRVAILTNADRAMVGAALAASGLGDALDDIISVEDIRQYKVDPRAYDLGCRRLASSPQTTSFVSSNAWDVGGASAFGLQCIRVRRSELPLEYPDMPPLAVVRSLDEIR